MPGDINFKMRKTIWLFGILLILFSMAAYAAICGQTPAENCEVNQTVTFALATYTLNDSDANGVMRVIGNNLILDCNKSIFQGNNTANSIFINASIGNNVTIRNCNMTNYLTGVLTDGNSTDYTFDGNAIRNIATGYNIGSDNATINNTHFSNVTTHYSIGPSVNYIMRNNVYQDNIAIYTVTDSKANFTVNETSASTHNVTIQNTGKVTFFYNGRKDFSVHKILLSIVNMIFPNNYVKNLNNDLFLAKNVSIYSSNLPSATTLQVGDFAPTPAPTTST